MKYEFGFVLLMTAIISGVIGAHHEEEVTRSFLISLSTGSGLLFVTVFVIDRMVENEREQLQIPARIAAYREMRDIYMQFRLLWGRMVADAFQLGAYSGPAPRLSDIVNGDMMGREAVALAAQLRTGSFVTLYPDRTWEEHLTISHSELSAKIDRCIRRYPMVLTPTQTKILHDLENSEFMNAINRDKASMHVDMQRETLGYSFEAFESFFDAMRSFQNELCRCIAKLPLEDERSLPSSEWTEDMASNSGDILARLMTGHVMQGMTYHAPETYASVVRRAIASRSLYFVHIVLVKVTHADGGEIGNVREHRGPMRLHTIAEVQRLITPRQALDLKNLIGRARRQNSDFNAILVNFFGGSELTYPFGPELAQMKNNVLGALQRQKVSGLLFDPTGNRININ